MANQLPTEYKGRKAAKYRGAECLNCKHPLELSDVYCAYCGQLNTTKNLSLKDFFGEFIGSIITYDSRFRFTLKDLLFKPGVITRNYVHGQRLKYANPFRFFLSVSIIYFIIQGLILTFTGQNNFVNNNTSQNKGPNFELKKDSTGLKLIPAGQDTVQIDSILEASGIVLDSTQKKEAGDFLDAHAKKYGYPTSKEIDSMIQLSIEENKERKRRKDSMGYTYYPEAQLDTLNWVDRNVKRFVMYYEFYEKTEIEDPVAALDSLKHRNTGYNRWAYQKNEAFDQIKKNPSDFFNYLMEKTPFFVFFFTPFYALFFWLIYSKKKYTFMEHMIFIFHIFSFVFLAMLISLPIDMIIGEDILSGILFLLIGPFYFYKALRNFYQQNRLITIVKFIFLNGVFWFSATISAILFFAITAAMY